MHPPPSLPRQPPQQQSCDLAVLNMNSVANSKHLTVLVSPYGVCLRVCADPGEVVFACFHSSFQEPEGAAAQPTLTCISDRNVQSGHRFLHLTAQIHLIWGQKRHTRPLQYQLWFLQGCWGRAAGKLILSAVVAKTAIIKIIAIIFHTCDYVSYSPLPLII